MFYFIFNIFQQDFFCLVNRQPGYSFKLGHLLSLCLKCLFIKFLNLFRLFIKKFFFLFQGFDFSVKSLFLLNKSSLQTLDFISSFLNFSIELQPAFMNLFLCLKQYFPFFSFRNFLSFADYSLCFLFSTANFGFCFFLSNSIPFR